MITYVSKSLAQQIVNTLKDVCRQDINFINENGRIFASTNQKRIGDFHEIGLKAASTGDVIEVAEDDSFTGTLKGVNLPVLHNGRLVAVIGISGEPDEVRNYGYLAVRITQLLIREQELNDYSHSLAEKKKYIIQSLIHEEQVNRDYLLDCLKQMDIATDTEKRFLVIRLRPHYNTENVSMIEQKIYQVFQMSETVLFACNYPNEYVAILDTDTYAKNSFLLRKFADDCRSIVNIGVGSSHPLHRLSKSYQDAVIAVETLSESADSYAEFDSLDLEMILACMSESLKEQYVHKILGGLFAEDIALLRAYYDEGMSLTKTCERLFIHKNSLQYKLNRIHKLCGYDPRNFKNAVVLYLAVSL